MTMINKDVRWQENVAKLNSGGGEWGWEEELSRIVFLPDFLSALILDTVLLAV